MTDHSKVIRLASQALQAGIDDDWQRAAQAISKIIRECPDQIGMVLLVWCDAYVIHATDGRPDASNSKPVLLAFISTEDGLHLTGDLLAADHSDVPLEFAWAGRAVSARLAMDKDTYLALLEAIPPGRAGAYFNALLMTVALSIRTLPRGLALPSNGVESVEGS